MQDYQPLWDMELQEKKYKKIKFTSNLFRKDMQLKGVC